MFPTPANLPDAVKRVTAMRLIGRAFTLVELLVVIGIIAVIAAIVFPVLSGAREKARQTECASNLRQLGMASLMYAQDSDGRFPPFRNTNPGPDCDHTGGIANGWGYCAPALLHAALFPYAGESRVWFCPSDPVAGQVSNAWWVNHRFSSYAFGFSRTWRMNPDGLYDLNGNLMLSASETRMILDPNAMLHLTGYNGWPGGGNHFGGVNICFVDGHVKWVNRTHR
jgi:prepilin-type N-terminal cleavage/methylation domain-containing protein/prepilin-type processing-associated H-X9-DG protein